MEFGLIKDIDVRDTATWQDKSFITIDVDWAPDAVITDTANLLEEAGVQATWLITHDTPVLERLRKNPSFELGIHPNFNHLLDNGACGPRERNPENIIKALLDIVPEAVTLRSHSMTQNSRLLDLFAESGIKYDLNHFIPEQAGMGLKPWYLWNALTKVPYFWEDDLTLLYKNNTPFEELTKRPGMKVYDFHPIHVFLNTENSRRYENVKGILKNPEKLTKHRYEGRGTRFYFKKLIGMD